MKTGPLSFTLFLAENGISKLSEERKKKMSMNIYSQPGTQVVYANVTAGWDYDQEQAQAYLVPNTIYTIAATEIDDSRTLVLLEEVPDVWFNSVLFDDLY